ncbi:DUF3265 domain-containing protein [Vibrio fluvialis]|nr:DUF3265 domain-containing protein [Vibrio fluvialis]
MTNNLRVIRHAWHFWFAVSFGGESGLQKVSLCGIRPLTRRYVSLKILVFISSRLWPTARRQFV